MARPIEPTPILYGDDARRLLEDLNKPTSKEKKKHLQECDAIYRRLSKNAKK